jgi:hypothetical protein
MKLDSVNLNVLFIILIKTFLKVIYPPMKLLK